MDESVQANFKVKMIIPYTVDSLVAKLKEDNFTNRWGVGCMIDTIGEHNDSSGVFARYRILYNEHQQSGGEDPKPQIIIRSVGDEFSVIIETYPNGCTVEDRRMVSIYIVKNILDNLVRNSIPIYDVMSKVITVVS